MSGRTLVKVPFREYLVEASSFCLLVAPPREKKPNIPELGDSRTLLWQDDSFSSGLFQEDIFRAVRDGLVFPCTTAQISDALARQMSGREQVLLAGGEYYGEHEHNYFCVFGPKQWLTIAYVYRNRTLRRWEKHALDPEDGSCLARRSRIFYNPPWRSVLTLR